MRVIAGDFKGRQIQAVKGHHTRPTTDKIKENVFNMIGQFFVGGRVLDLFAGSGNLGIEALSRGMDHGVFVDMNVNAINVIKENIVSLKLQDKTEVYRSDATRALGVLAKKDAKFDLIFLDPPYGKISITALLDLIVEKDLLNHDGLVICEYLEGRHIQYKVSKLKELKRAEYGKIQILILKKRKTIGS